MMNPKRALIQFQIIKVLLQKSKCEQLINWTIIEKDGVAWPSSSIVPLVTLAAYLTSSLTAGLWAWWSNKINMFHQKTTHSANSTSHFNILQRKIWTKETPIRSSSKLSKKNGRNLITKLPEDHGLVDCEITVSCICRQPKTLATRFIVTSRLLTEIKFNLKARETFMIFVVSKVKVSKAVLRNHQTSRTSSTIPTLNLAICQIRRRIVLKLIDRILWCLNRGIWKTQELSFLMAWTETFMSRKK